MAKRSTVIDVAESAGVGASTVSRHLRGITVRPKLAERIEKAVRELDYEPDETARSLRGGRSRTIGVLFPKVSNSYFSHALQRIEERASEHGYTVALLTHHNDPKEQLNELLTLRRCRAEGVIITALPGTTLQDIRTVLPNEPIVSLDSFFSPELDSVLLQNRQSAANATKHFLDHGYKAVACVTARPGTYSYRERMDGYSAEMRSRGLQSQMIVAEDYPELDEMLRVELSSEQRPEALLALSDTAVLHIMKLFQELRLSPARRPKMIGFDDFELAAFLDVPLSVVRQPIPEMVDAAMNSLLRQIKEGTTPGTQTLSMPGQLIIRNSCGCK